MFSFLFQLIQGVVSAFVLLIVLLALWVVVEELIKKIDMDKQIGRKD